MSVSLMMVFTKINLMLFDKILVEFPIFELLDRFGFRFA